ncbi:MAG TPA: ATP-binding cassette domain-containing protein [Xanthobacteraceae bacterium]|jgi:NitT/TauT family transport system ATP-binding protein
MKGPPPIEVNELRKVFRQAQSGQAIVAIERLDLRIAPREVVAIVGQTGCGKSTFFDLMIGLDRPTAGSIRIGGRTPYGEFDHFRGQIATVFQQDRLLPWRSALDNVELPLELTGVAGDERRKRSMAWLERLGLAAFAGAYPRELSGGMRQRVAIARAFVLQPAILLADEAFGHLDEVTAADLRETFLALAWECGSTAVLITHQLEEAIAVGDRVIVFGKPARLLADIHVERWDKADHAMLREAIQATLQANVQDARLRDRSRQA